MDMIAPLHAGDRRPRPVTQRASAARLAAAACPACA
ncbi:hypothetical protein BPC006_I2844 [Burkholderia pseudomallei BPC006]|nr:hypothetical protein BPC006_I2844 [Burkholderia pseudomallei BPC006]